MFTLEEGAPGPGEKGWTSQILTSLGRHTTNKFGKLVRKARGLLSKQARASTPRVRRRQKPCRRMRASADGGPFVKEEWLRLCGQSKEKDVHIAQALATPFPQSSSRYELTPECIAAVQTMADMPGRELATWRKAQVAGLKTIAKKAASITEAIYQQHTDVPASVKALRREINVAFIAILCEAIQWPDVDLCRGLTRGFHVAGDLRAQDSHTFRPADELEETVGTHWELVDLGDVSPDRVCAHKAVTQALMGGQRSFNADTVREWGAPELSHPTFVHMDGIGWLRTTSFNERWEQFSSEEASLAWLSTCTHQLTRKAGAAAKEAQEGSPEALDLLRAVSARTAEEMAAGHVGPAMSEKDMLRLYSGAEGFLARVAPRFGLWQGLKMVVSPSGAEVPALDEHGEVIWKLRCIDDFKVNGVNGVTWLSEHLVMPNFEFPARIGAEFSRMLDEKPQLGQKRPGPGLVLGLDDLFAAYRRIPNADSRRFGIVGVFDVEAQEVRWHEVLGLPFGLSSAPIIFNRVPALLCVFARAWCGVAVDQFVDDYITVDRDDADVTVSGRHWSSSAQWALAEIHDMSGLGLAPDKRKPAAHVNVLLGVEGDLSAFKDERRISFRPTKRRCKAILDTLERCRKKNKMRPREAANLLGRLTFALSSSYTSVGRAATQPLVDRASDRAEGRGVGAQDRHRWTASMTHMLDFFKSLFADLPDLSFNFQEKPKKKVVVYTDASFSSSRNGMGFIVFDQETGRRHVCDAACPAELMEKWNELDANPWLLREFAGDHTLQTHINSMELLAILAAVWTVGPDMLQDREVLFFCDNTSAMSAAVHGYARSPNMAALSNTLHLALASLRVKAWFEWVPSAANCADIPSRPQGTEEELFYQQHKLLRWAGGMQFPSLAQIRAPRLNDVRT
jgi:hypothetical protein